MLVFSSRMRMVTHQMAIIIGAGVIGCVSGVTSWALFEALDAATSTRLEHIWLVWLLPIAALMLGLLYHYAGGAANGGTSLVIEQSWNPDSSEHDVKGHYPHIPLRMAPFIFGATFIAQLTGASVGREGAAIQISGSLTSLLTKPLRLKASDRRLLFIAAMAGAFGGAFGVPFAGAIFGLEVRRTRRLRYEALAPALAASVSADFIVEALGRHTPVTTLAIHIDWWIILRLAAVGIAAGLMARFFVGLLQLIKKTMGEIITWAPARPIFGALATLALMLLFGRSYLGLSLPLISDSLAGNTADWWDPVLKVLFTAIALGCAIPGGEVTPLFVMGATLGSVLSAPLHLPPALVAAACLAAVFGAAANTPIACAVLTVELFGAGIAVPAAVVCIVAYSISPRRGIYEGQRSGSRKVLRASARQ